MNEQTPKVGLVLTGGGARAAYQVGVLRAISEFMPDATQNPFPVICGTSAGAINAASIAVSADNFAQGVRELESVWKNFHVGQIYRSDWQGVTSNAIKCVTSLLSRKYGKYNAVSLLDNTPLQTLLTDRFPFGNIQRAINKGSLYALGITVSGYSSHESVTFFQAARGVTSWKRAQRIGLMGRIGVKHLLASSAIPFIFPAVKINREFFGDGSMGQLAPISPALHLGADKVLIIGVQKLNQLPSRRVSSSDYPPLAQIGGHVMNRIFVDSMEIDLERLQRINRTIKLIPSHKLTENNVLLRPIESMVISPSEEINEIAQQFAHALPALMRLIYRSIGALGPKGSSMLSYVLFESLFCQALIDLGYRDTVQQKDAVLKFIGVG